MTSILKKIGVALLASLFIGCSSGGDDNAPSGYFIDAPVENLTYECSSGTTGTTGSQGEFTCEDGDTVIFRIGTLTFGPILAEGVITPLHLFPDDVEQAYNLAQLLHSLDDDSNPGNNINLISLDLGDLDLETDSHTFLNELASALAAENRTYYDRNEAIARMLDYIIQNGGSDNYGITRDLESELELLETLLCTSSEELVNGVCSDVEVPSIGGATTTAEDEDPSPTGETPVVQNNEIDYSIYSNASAIILYNSVSSQFISSLESSNPGSYATTSTSSECSDFGFTGAGTTEVSSVGITSTRYVQGLRVCVYSDLLTTEFGGSSNVIYTFDF